MWSLQGTCGSRGGQDIAGDNKQAGSPGKHAASGGTRGRGVVRWVCGGLGKKEEAPRPSGFGILRSRGLLRLEGRLECTPTRTHPLRLATFQRAQGPLGRWALPPVGASRPPLRAAEERGSR